MHAFFAMSWNPETPDEAAIAGNLRAALLRQYGSPASKLEAAGFAIFDLSETAKASTIIPVISGSGRVLGAAFGVLFQRNSDRSTQKRVSQISGTSADHLLSNGGAEIASRFWGSYILMVRNEGTLCLIADPLSSCPCFYYRRGGVTAAFSNLEKCSFLDFRQFTINYEFVASLLTYDKIQTGETGLREVRELGAGERLQIRNGRLAIDTVWDPRDFAHGRDPGAAFDRPAALRETVTSSVQAWASAFGQIVVNVSGGLDSSILLSCLCNGPPVGTVRALHHVLQSGDPGEAVYARDVCRFLNCELQEVQLQPARRLAGSETHPATARPYRDFCGGTFSELFGRSVLADADAIFTGQGGDHLFLATDSALGFADYLVTRGWSPELRVELFNAARLSGKSIWTVLGEAARVWAWGGRSTMRDALESRNEFAVQLGAPGNRAEDLLPGWALNRRSLAPAKFDQISILSHLIHVRDGLNRSGRLQVIHPLMSQPIMEYCLLTPTYALCAGGKSRGLARLAFAGQIPASVRLRMTKGHAGMYFSGLLDASFKPVCDALIEGELVARGLLDAKKLQRFLADGRYRTSQAGNRLLVFYSIEAWLRTWTSIAGPSFRTSSQGSSPC